VAEATLAHVTEGEHGRDPAGEVVDVVDRGEPVGELVVAPVPVVALPPPPPSPPSSTSSPQAVARSAAATRHAELVRGRRGRKLETRCIRATYQRRPRGSTRAMRRAAAPTLTDTASSGIQRRDRDLSGALELERVGVLARGPSILRPAHDGDPLLVLRDEQHGFQRRDALVVPELFTSVVVGGRRVETSTRITGFVTA